MPPTEAWEAWVLQSQPMYHCNRELLSSSLWRGRGALGGNNNDQPGAGGGGLSAIYTDPALDAPTIVAGALSSLLGMTINRCSKRTDYFLEQKVCIAMKWLQSCFSYRRVVHQNYSRTFILCVSHLCYRWRWRRCRRRSWLCRR